MINSKHDNPQHSLYVALAAEIQPCGPGRLSRRLRRRHMGYSVFPPRQLINQRKKENLTRAADRPLWALLPAATTCLLRAGMVRYEESSPAQVRRRWFGLAPRALVTQVAPKRGAPLLAMFLLLCYAQLPRGEVRRWIQPPSTWPPCLPVADPI
ncbi:unnamed protein product [Periconia digitata]|uniref:Uncharacterized protein n=1 Tax=Periconia digitata TaxID=1303443 RepID=A0A9W4UCW5_9PLEO|nr:unnamed protein product [Periconia digitata]